MPWPAWYNTTDHESGTCYIPSHRFQEVLHKHEHHGQAWRYRNKWTTYCPSRRISYKALERLPHHGPEQFWQIMEVAKHAGLSPPTSFADLFLSVYRAPMPRVSVRAPFYGMRFGGWEEVFRRGPTRGKVYQYDINKAYRWAASCGLPDLRTAYPTRDFTRQNAVYLVSNILPGRIPYRRVPAEVFHLVTSEERNALDLSGARVHFGVAFDRTIDLSPTFETIDKNILAPWIVAGISRSFWGIWNTTTAPEVLSWRHGERRRIMKNPWYNPIWSAFITSRIKLRMNIWRKYSLHCFVDSLHTTIQLPTGDGIGDWRLVNIFNKFWCRGPGLWGNGPYTLRHAGLASKSGLAFTKGYE